jgi:hypothetical protein
MRTNELRAASHKTPFRPFTIRMADGRQYDVPHQDFLLIHPGGRAAIVATIEDEFFEVVDIGLIASLHYGNGRKTQRRRKAG